MEGYYNLINPTEKAWEDKYAGKAYKLAPFQEISVPVDILKFWLGNWSLGDEKAVSEEQGRIVLRRAGISAQDGVPHCVVIREFQTAEFLKDFEEKKAVFYAEKEPELTVDPVKLEKDREEAEKFFKKKAAAAKAKK